MSEYIEWLRPSNPLQTSDGVGAIVLDLLHEPNEEIINAWSKQFRENYCTDEAMDDARAPMGITRSDFLQQIKFPDSSSLGAATRVADFSEILVGDYLNYALSYYVPRTRYDDKKNKNTSPQGVDVVGFKIQNTERISPNDELITVEVKAAFRNQNNQTLSNAIEDSKKDYFIRTPEALNAIRQRLKNREDVEGVKVVERFQNSNDRPYKLISGAAAVHSNATWDDSIVESAIVDHPNQNVFLMAVKGEDLLNLANNLYQKACDNA